MSSKIQFRNLEVKHSFKEAAFVKERLSQIFIKEGIQLKKLTYIFCLDKYLLNLNIQYLQHDTFTDILTFDLSENSSQTMAEIYISLERVEENSRELETSLNEELYRVMIHGILHLCGYNDHSNEEKAEMRMKENFYLAFLDTKKS